MVEYKCFIAGRKSTMDTVQIDINIITEKTM